LSKDLLSEFWEIDLPHAEKWLLMALLHHANWASGANVYPGVKLLSWMTDYERRQVTRLLAKLEERGGLIPVGRLASGTTVYKIDLSKFKKKPPLTRGKPGRPRSEKPHDKMSQGLPEKPHDKMSRGFPQEKGMTKSHGVTKNPMTFSEKPHDISGRFSRTPPDPPIRKEHDHEHVGMNHAQHEHDTHTCAKNEKGEVCVSRKEGEGSRFDQETCRKYADFLHDLDQGIKWPGAFARSIFKSGEADSDIDLFLAGKARITRKRRAPGLDVGGHPPTEWPELPVFPCKPDSAFLAKLKVGISEKVNPHTFKTWFAPIQFAAPNGKLIYIAVPNYIFKDWIQNNYFDVLEESLAEMNIKLGRGEDEKKICFTRE
jgi:hypothetical protein